MNFRFLFLALFTVAFLCGSATSGEAMPRGRGVTISTYLKEEDVAVLRSWNVNLVRIPIVWEDPVGADSSQADTYQAWLDAELARVDTILPWFENRGIKVVIALHTPPGGFTRRDTQATHRVFVEQWAQDSLVEAWKKISTRYKGRTSLYGYALLSEPAQQRRPRAPLLDWNALAQKIATEVRAIDPVTPIIMTTEFGKASRVVRLRTLRVPNVIYTVHVYDPWKFTHQGITNSKRLFYPTRIDNRASLERKFTRFRQFQKRTKARVYVGEFSVVRWAPPGTGARYLRDITRIFEKFKWDYTYHAFREADVWSLEHTGDKSNPNPSLTETDRLRVMKNVFKRNSF